MIKMDIKLKKINNNSTDFVGDKYQKDDTNYILYTKENIEDLKRTAFMLGYIKGTTDSSNKLLESQSTIELSGEVEKLKQEFDFLKEQLKNVNDNLSDRIEKLDGKTDKIDDKITKINDKIIDIDKRTVAIETLLKSISSNIENNHKDITNKLDKLDKISGEISTINNRLLTIETENKVKETWKDRIFRQCMLPITGGAMVFILTKLLGKFFP